MSSVLIKQVAFSYGSFTLSPTTMLLEQGSISALIGASGSGKSTLLRLIAGFIQPSAGEIWLGEEIVASANSMMPAHKRNVGLVFQNYALFPHLTVEKNILFGCKEKTPLARKAQLEQWVTLLGITHLLTRYPHEISGGEQQRVALARALIAGPKVLLMDEPFANLDSELRKQVREDCLALLRAQHITTLLVTHDRFEASAFAHQVYTMENGQLLKAV